MEAGMFAVDQATRQVSGLLVPYGVLSKPNLTGNAPLRFGPGDITIPRDPDIVTLNLEHDRFSPIGRAVQLTEHPDGVHAVFRIASTDEGDSWLADHTATAQLSPEVKGITRRAGDWASAAVTGAASVAEGAFAGAGLFSIAVTEPDPTVTPDPAPAPTPDPDPAPAVPATDPEADPDDPEGLTAMADAVAPTALTGRARPGAAPALTKAGFFAALHQTRRTGSKEALAPYMQSANEMGMFAVNNITYDDANGIAAQAQLPHTWLGELAQGAAFPRTIVPLLTQATLQSLVATGWVWLTKPRMQKWSGNKTPVPSSTATAGPKEYVAQRFGNVNDLAREYYDFHVTEVIDSFIQAVVDSYYVESDDYVLDQLLAGATVATPTATTVSGQLAQMARAVLAARVSPTFAVVAPDVFDAFTDVPQSEQSAYFSPTISLDSGSLAGIPLLPDDRLAAGEAIVGAKSAATVWELPGVPIRVAAPDLLLGGVDEAMFGYIAAGVTYAAGIQKATITIPAAAVAAKASSK